MAQARMLSGAMWSRFRDEPNQRRRSFFGKQVARSPMRVLFNGASTVRPKTGVGHTTIHLHRALTTLSPGDEFWLYPGEKIRGVAGRYTNDARQPKGSISPPKPRGASLIKRLVLNAARLGYAAHF